MDWLNQNASTVGALSSIGVLIVWALYASLFYSTYKRQTKPRIVIDHVSGPGPDARCIVTNLSGQSLYLECVLAIARTENESFSGAITENAELEATQRKRDIVALAKRGPLEPGQLVLVGSLREMARRAVAEAGTEDPDAALNAVRSLDVRVAAMTSVQDRPVGASRRFTLNLEDGTAGWAPARDATRQLRSWRSQRRVREWLESAGVS